MNDFLASVFDKVCRPPANGSASPLANVKGGLLPADYIATGRRCKIVLVNGCFDLFHPGHAATLMFARHVKLFGVRPTLVAAVNSDASVARLKGPDRPYQTFEHRARVVAAVRGVDLVVGFEDDTPERLIKSLRPDVLVKGIEYLGKVVPGEEYVVSRGGFVLYAPKVEGYSTSLQAEKLGLADASRKPPLAVFADSSRSRVFNSVDALCEFLATHPGYEYGKARNALSWLIEMPWGEAAGGHVTVLDREAFNAAAREYLARPQ